MGNIITTDYYSMDPGTGDTDFELDATSVLTYETSVSSSMVILPDYFSTGVTFQNQLPQYVYNYDPFEKSKHLKEVITYYNENQQFEGVGTINHYYSQQQVGIAEENVTEVRFYPNPAKDNLTVIIPSALETANVILLDMQGRTVKSVTINSAGEIAINGITPGIYQLIISDEEKVLTSNMLMVE